MLPALSLSTLLALSALAGPPAAAKAAVDGGYLVWTAAGEAADAAAGGVPGRTVWLDAAGREQASREGVWIAHDGRLYRLERRRAAVALPGCDREEGDPAAPDEGVPDAGKLAGLYLAPVGAGEPIALRPLPDAAEEGASEHEEHVVLQAALGPYLFVEERSYTYSCGAHGFTTVSAFVYDLGAGARTTALEPAAAERARLEKAARAKFAAERRAAEDGEGGGMGPDKDGSLGLAATLPHWIRGRLRLDHLWWADACYACGDGVWTSYTTTTVVPGRAVPAALTPWAKLPAPVVARLEAAGETPAGVSAAPEALRAAFAAK